VGIATPLGSRPQSARLRPLQVLAFVAALCLTVTGCNGVGFNEQTNKFYQGAAGITNRDGEVYALNVLVVTDGKGNGTMVGTLLNTMSTADSLQGVTATDSNGKAIPTKLASPVPLAPEQAVKLQTNASVRLTGKGLVAGYYIHVTFTFTTAAPLSMSIPVLLQGTEYSSVPVGRT
jgi:hypothetical protein